MENVKNLIDNLSLILKNTKTYKDGYKAAKHLIPELEFQYQRVLKKKFRAGCDSCWIDAYHELKALTDKQIDNLLNLKYKIKDGKIIWLDGVAYSNQSPNLSNELLAQMFKLKGKDWFEMYPVDEPKNSKKAVEPEQPKTSLIPDPVTTQKPEVVTNIFDGLTVKELREMCKNYPKDEWFKMKNPIALIKYLESKIK